MFKNLYLFVGCSGSGKTTIVNTLVTHLGEKQVVSCTTRPRRYPGENGYHFLSDSEFDALENVIAPTTFAGNRYGVTVSGLDAGSFYIVDIAGVIDLKQHYTNRPIKVIGIHSTEAELAARMATRGDSEESISTRIQHDTQKFRTMFDVCDIVIRNADVDDAVKAAIAYINTCEDRNPMQRREFFVDTPIGRLRARASMEFEDDPSAKDDPDGYPGIFVDLVREGKEVSLLSCTEWDSADHKLQTCVYGNLGDDAPTSISVHR